MQAFATEPGGTRGGDLAPLPGDPGGRDLAVLPIVEDYNDWIPNFEQFTEWWGIFFAQWSFRFSERDAREYDSLLNWANQILASLNNARDALLEVNPDPRAIPSRTFQNSLFEQALRDVGDLEIESVQELVQGETTGSVFLDDCEAADTNGDGEEEETIFRFDESLRRRRMRAS